MNEEHVKELVYITVAERLGQISVVYPELFAGADGFLLKTKIAKKVYEKAWYFPAYEAVKALKGNPENYDSEHLERIYHELISEVLVLTDIHTFIMDDYYNLKVKLMERYS